MKLKLIILTVVAITSLVTATVAQVPNYVPSNGLVGWWPFNGNANDESGNGNNGKVNGATLINDRFGSANAAYSFDGSGNYIQTTALHSKVFAYSVSLWIKTKTGGTIMTGKKNVNAPSWVMTDTVGITLDLINQAEDTNIGKIRYLADGNYLQRGKLSNMILNDNKWYHVVGVWNGPNTNLTINPADFEIYIDGQLANSSNINLNSYTAPINGYMGVIFGKHTNWGSWSNYNGIIDDIGIWNRALTQQEITNLYNAGNLGIHIGNVTGLCNQTIDVPVKVSSFRNILTMQGSINWNSADLRFESIANFGPASTGLSASNFGLSKTSTGKLSFSWNDGSDQGITLPDSTTLFIMRFTALGTAIRSVPITFSADPLPLEFYDREFNQQQVQTTNGNVQVNCEINITGKVLTPLSNGVRTTSVVLSGGTSPQTVTTDTSGAYQFKVLPGSYILTPSKNYEQLKTNGISTLDLALIQAHILQRVSFNSPYKVIAADVNSSSSVTTVDILHLRRLILGIDTSLPNNRIWAFVDGDHVFANPLQPFPYPSTKSLVNQDRDVTHTFRGIKLGDVNYDRNPMLDQAPSGDTLRMYYETEDQHDGLMTVRIKAKAIQNLMGAQATLAWDPSKLTLLNVTPGLSNLGTGDKWKQDGYLTLSWNDQRAEGVSFTTGFEWLVLTMQKKGIFSQTSLWLSEEKLQSEAFNQSFQSIGLSMERNPIAGIVPVSFRVYPNPADRYIDVEWTSERKEKVRIRLLDVSGRMLFEQNRSVDAGVQKLRIERDQRVGSSEILFLEMEQGGVIQRKKIMTVKQNP